MNQEDNFQDSRNQEMADNQSNHVEPEILTQGQPLSDFLLQLEDYTPTVSAVIYNNKFLKPTLLQKF